MRMGEGADMGYCVALRGSRRISMVRVRNIMEYRAAACLRSVTSLKPLLTWVTPRV